MLSLLVPFSSLKRRPFSRIAQRQGRSSHSCVKQVGFDLPLYSSSLLCSPRLCSREIGGGHPFLDSREAKGGRHLSYSSLVSSPLLPDRLSLFLFIYIYIYDFSLSLVRDKQEVAARSLSQARRGVPILSLLLERQGKPSTI